MNKEKLIPKLRFNGFVDEWEEVSLSEITNKIGDGLHTTPKYIKDSNYYFINGNNLNNKNIVINENTKCVPLKEFEKYKINFKNTILISINGTIGNLAYYNGETVILGKSVAYINLNENINKEFIFNYLNTDKIKYYFNSKLTGSTIKNLSLKTLKNTKIHIPFDNAETNKISNFLENIDNKIELLEIKHQYYQLFKRYLMQQIFQQKLRFNFNNDWIEYQLKDLLTVKSSTISINKLNDNTGNYALYGAGGFLKIIDFYEMETDYISIVKDGSGVGDISFHEKKSSIVNTSQYLLPKKDFDIHFLYYLLQTLNLLKYVNGSSIPHIYFKDFCIEKVKIPSLPEQKEIANLLSNVDIKIKSIENQINETKNFKKGLLQQMFI